jgi:hypothetical protein
MTKFENSIGIFLPMKMEQIECFETSAYKIQTPGNHPEENMQHTEHGESLKSKKVKICVHHNMPSGSFGRKSSITWYPRSPHLALFGLCKEHLLTVAK